MPAVDRPDGDARKAEDDGLSLPELLAQAAGLGAALEAQQAAFAADLRGHLAGIPGLPQPDPLPAPPASPAPMPSGFPGAERMASLQDGAQRLGALTAELMAKIAPR